MNVALGSPKAGVGRSNRLGGTVNIEIATKNRGRALETLLSKSRSALLSTFVESKTVLSRAYSSKR